MFDQNIKRIGFACKFLHGDQSLPKKFLTEAQGIYNTRTTTAQWLRNQPRAVAEQRLREIMQHNIQSFFNLVDYVATLPANQRMVRLSSDCLPMYTHPEWRYFWQQTAQQLYCAKYLGAVGAHARANDVRLSMHPGQFVCLGSNNADVVSRSIEEFEYHADLVRWMGYGTVFQDFKINVHISGRQGPAGIKAVIPRLSTVARNCITIENDENRWGIDDSIELAEHCALVFDCHHHWVRDGDYLQSTDDRYKRIVDSWRGVRPAMHYSLSREDILVDHCANTLPDRDALIAAGTKRGKLRAHSDMMWNTAANDYVLQFLEFSDIMIEAKSKNLASTALYNYAVETGVIT